MKKGTFYTRIMLISVLLSAALLASCAVDPSQPKPSETATATTAAEIKKVPIGTVVPLTLHSNR